MSKFPTGSLRNIAIGKRGVSYKPEDIVNGDDKPFKCLLSSGNIQAGITNTDSFTKIDPKCVSDEQVINTNDILVCMSNGSKRLVGKSSRLSSVDSKRFCVGAFCSTFSPSESADADFVFYVFQSDLYKNQVYDSTEGSAINNLKNSTIEEFQIPIPPLLEQKKIAEIISSFDLNLELLKIKINKLIHLKKSFINNFIYRDYIGQEIVDSKVYKLNDICIKIQDGTHFSPKSNNGSFLYLTSKNIRKGFMSLSDIQFISDQEHSQIYKRCDVKYGDILFTKDGASTGNACKNIIDYPFSLLSSVAFLRVDKSNCISDFMLQTILSNDFQEKIVNEMTGNAITRLTLTKIKNLQVKLPSLENQKLIAEALNSFDVQINLINKKFNQITFLKKGVLNTLLSGRKRVLV